MRVNMSRKLIAVNGKSCYTIEVGRTTKGHTALATRTPFLNLSRNLSRSDKPMAIIAYVHISATSGQNTSIPLSSPTLNTVKHTASAKAVL